MEIKEGGAYVLSKIVNFDGMSDDDINMYESLIGWVVVADRVRLNMCDTAVCGKYLLDCTVAGKNLTLFSNEVVPVIEDNV